MIAFAHATTQAMIDTAGEVTPAFGRGEVITVNGTPVELLLVKNPMGFRLSLASFKPEGCDTMICINDEYADGRDARLAVGRGLHLAARHRRQSRVRRTRVGHGPAPRIRSGAGRIGQHRPGGIGRELREREFWHPKHIYCTYTAMLKTRAALAKIADVADAGVGK